MIVETRRVVQRKPCHDAADRLISETRTGSGLGGAFTNTYQYDGNGNRTSVTRNGTTYAYGVAGDNDQFTTGEGYTASNYDADGNPGTFVTPGGAMNFVYDEMGRVTSITGVGASTFLYDGDGRRVQRVAGGATTRFVYDGDGIVLEVNATGGNPFYRLPGVGYSRNGLQFYEQENALGSLVTTRNASAAWTGMTEYDAYGREVYANGPDRGDFRFAGKHGYANDDATGMQLLGARYYLAPLGRFLTPDPIGHEGGLNLYAYCADSPLARVDPSGHGPEGILMGLSRWMRPARYSTMEDAGIAAIQSVMGQSNKRAVEYGGLIYQYPDRTWSYTPGLTLNPPRYDACNPFLGIPLLPKGVTVPANYHTHPHKSGDAGDLFASQPDRQQADFRLYQQYRPYSSYNILYWFVGDGNLGRVSYWAAGSSTQRGSVRILEGWDSFGRGKNGRPIPLP